MATKILFVLLLTWFTLKFSTSRIEYYRQTSPSSLIKLETHKRGNCEDWKFDDRTETYHFNKTTYQPCNLRTRNLVKVNKLISKVYIQINMSVVASSNDSYSIWTMLFYPDSDTGDLFTFKSEEQLEIVNSGQEVFDIYIQINPSLDTSSGAVSNVTVFSYFCPTKIHNFTVFNEISSGAADVSVNGTCVENAHTTDTFLPNAMCSVFGIYKDFKSSCQCDINYKPENGYCVLDCPGNSTRSADDKRCVCNSGFYREHGKQSDSFQQCQPPQYFAPCPYDSHISTDWEKIEFPESYIYENITVQCNRQTDHPLNVTRSCLMSENNTGVWDSFTTAGCGKNPQFCSNVSIQVNDSIGEILLFNKTLVDDVITISCKRNAVNISRKCLLFGNNKPVWENITLDDCHFITCPSDTITTTKESLFFNETIAGDNYTVTCKKRRNTTYPLQIIRKCILNPAEGNTANWENISIGVCDENVCPKQNYTFLDHTLNIDVTISFNETLAGSSHEYYCNSSKSHAIYRKCIQVSTKAARWDIVDLTSCQIPPPVCLGYEKILNVNNTIVFHNTTAGQNVTIQCGDAVKRVNITRACIQSLGSHTATWDTVSLDKCQPTKPTCPAGKLVVMGTNETLIINETTVGENITVKCQTQTENVNVSITRKCVPFNLTSAVWLNETLDKCRLACPPEILTSTAGNEPSFIFNSTFVGNRVVVECTTINLESVEITRRCLYNSNEGVAFWEDFDYKKCNQLSTITIEELTKVNITSEIVLKLSEILVTLTANASNIKTSKEIDDVTTMMRKLLNVNNNVTISINILQSVDQILSVKNTILRNSSVVNSNILSALDNIASGLLDNPIEFSGSMFGFTSKNQDNLNGTFISIPQLSGQNNERNSSNKSNNQVKLQYSASSSQNLSMAELYIPSEVFSDNLVTRPNIYSYAFKSDGFFLYNNNKSDKIPNSKNDQVLGKVDSLILATSIHNVTVQNLSTPIEITFKISDNRGKEDDDSEICTFWNWLNADVGEKSYWSKRGCNKSRVFKKENERYVTCECNHLTNFALLLNVYDESHEDSSSSDALRIVSLVGCSISVVSLIATLISYSGIRELRSRVPQKIIINFSLSLLFLLLTFMFGVDDSLTGAENKTSKVCHAVASMIHAFILSTFLWMAIQAIFLYKKAVRATQNRGESKKAYRVCFWLVWGASGIIAGVTSIFTKSQFNNQTTCIIRGNIFYYTTLIPVSCIIVINFMLFGPIIKTIYGHFKFSGSEHKLRDKNLWKTTKITISCTTFLGLTWILAFFSISDARVVFQWIFVIFNSLQGFLLFIFYVALNDRIINAWKDLLMKERQGKGNTSSAASAAATTSTKDLVLKNRKATTISPSEVQSTH